ncbi:hypothetical protein COOONC_05577 [Cooperia oncophora]
MINEKPIEEQLGYTVAGKNSEELVYKIGYSSPLTLHDRASKIKAGTHGDCYALQPTLMAAVPAIMDRIFKAVSEEVAASPRIMQELFKLNYERKRARYQEGYCSPFLDR